MKTTMFLALATACFATSFEKENQLLKESNRVLQEALAEISVASSEVESCSKSDAVVVWDDGNTVHGTGQAEFGGWYEVIDAPTVIVEPLEACTAVTNDVEGAVAVIQRGSCYFSEKVRNAQNAGARAVIIVNNGGNALTSIECGPEGCNDITIPAVFLESEPGAQFLELLRDDPGHQVHLGCAANYNFHLDSWVWIPRHHAAGSGGTAASRRLIGCEEDKDCSANHYCLVRENAENICVEGETEYVTSSERCGAATSTKEGYDSCVCKSYVCTWCLVPVNNDLFCFYCGTSRQQGRFIVADCSNY